MQDRLQIILETIHELVESSHMKSKKSKRKFQPKEKTKGKSFIVNTTKKMKKPGFKKKK